MLKQSILLYLILMGTILLEAECQMMKFENKKVIAGALPGSRVLTLPVVPSLYNGDNIDEFLGLCPDGCSPNCPLLSLDQVTKPKCTPAEKDILKALKYAQAQMKEYRDHLLKPMITCPVTMLKLSMITLVFIMGFFLILRGHFRFKTLFCKDVPDPTYGIPIWQFKLMKFTPTEVPDTRPQSVRVAELHRRIAKKNAEREALRQLRKRTREYKQSHMTEHERQFQMIEAKELERQLRKGTTIAKKKKRGIERRLSGAMSAKFVHKDDFGSVVQSRKRRKSLAVEPTNAGKPQSVITLAGKERKKKSKTTDDS